MVPHHPSLERNLWRKTSWYPSLEHASLEGWVGHPWLPPFPYGQPITSQPADVTGSQQRSCQSVQKTEKREWDSVFFFSDAVRSDTPSWAPPVSQLAGNYPGPG